MWGGESRLKRSESLWMRECVCVCVYNVYNAVAVGGLWGCFACHPFGFTHNNKPVSSVVFPAGSSTSMSLTASSNGVGMTNISTQ